MPKKIVEVPGMGNVEFPDSMNDDAISTILAGYSKQASPTSDSAMAQANVRMALANVPRPANPIDQAQPSALFDPRIQAGAKIAGNIVSQNVKQGAQALWDTSLGSIPLVMQRGTGPAVTPAQIEASARLKGAAKNAVTNYMGGMVGEELSPARPFTQPQSPMVPKLLNASGNVTPDTLEAIQKSAPALQAAEAPVNMTQAGMAEHARNLSLKIDSQIAPVIKANATRDVTASTAKIAADLRAEITPEMKRINPGTANVIEKTAKSLENAKTLGSLDEVRQQLNDRVLATKSRTVSKQYLGRALEDVRGAIADHAQAVRPDLPVRALRTQQSGLMQVADIFEGSAAKGATEETSRKALTLRQRAGQMLPKAVKAYTNPKAALAEKLLKPSTAEDFIRQAFQGHRPAAPAVIPQTAQAPGMSSLEMENLGRPDMSAEQSAIRDALQRAAEKTRGNQYGGTPNASASEIMQQVQQQRPELFTGAAAEQNPGTSSMSAQGAAFDTNVLSQVKAEHPEWNISQQLQEAATRANRARGR